MERQTDILIVGGGFAGLSCFKTLDRRKARVRLLTNRNHFLFTPLLPLAAAGTVEIRSIVEPMRTFERDPDEIIIGEALDVDPVRKTLRAQFEGQAIDIAWERLVLASGAATATFGVPGADKHCLFLKEMKDARVLRERVLLQFDKADHLEGKAREKALCFAIVGGGPTGVEAAGEIADLIRDDLAKTFRDAARAASVRIIESGKEILSVFDRTLAQYASRKLKQRGIRISTGIAVKAVEDGRLLLSDGSALEAETILWTAGNGPHPFTRRAAGALGVALDRAGRLPVDRRLRVPHPSASIFAIGDCAAAPDDKGRVLPATAQVAMKQGVFLGKELTKRGQAEHPFQFHSMGMLASLGGGSAIAELGGNVRFRGMFAWWFWKAAYLTRLVSMRNKFSVAFDWIRVRLFGRNTARIEF